MPFARVHISLQTSRRMDAGVSWLIAGLAAAILLIPAPVRAQSPVGCETGTAEAHLDVNDMRARILNNGGLFWNGTRSNYRIVRPDTINLVFSTSLVVGGMMDGELRTAASTYGPWEFWPGPIQDGDPSTWDCEKYDRIWTITHSDLDHLDDTGIAARDIREWPWKLGAPVIDGDGIPDNYDVEAGDRPEVLGDQTAWWIMNDAAGAHESTGSGAIGLEVRASAFALIGPGVARQTTFYRYRMTNTSSAPLDSAFIGLAVDPDIGYALDDYVGSDTTLGMGYVYNSGNTDLEIGPDHVPPAIGFLVLDSPGIHIRIDHPDGTLDNASSTFMTSFVRLVEGGVRGLPESASEFYHTMRGRWRDGTPVTVGFTGYNYSDEMTAFIYPADPPDFWSNYPNEVICDPFACYSFEDARMMLGSGPFSLAPGASADFTFAIVYGQGEDYLDSVRQLKTNARLVIA